MQHHTSTIESTLERLRTTVKGLESKEAAERLHRHGHNTLPEERRHTLGEIFLYQFKSPIIYILLIAAAVAFAIGEWVDGWFIMGVLLINASLGTYQEYSAAMKAEGLKQAIRTIAKVVRDGRLVEIDSVELTLGDIVVLESGTKVPADLRLIRTVNLTVNESLLTGESLDVPKEAEFVHDTDVQVADRRNMVYAGTYVGSGRGEGVVTAVGNETEVGKIATLLSRAVEGRAPLVVRMERLSMALAKAVAVVVAVLLAVGVMKGMELYGLFFFAVALAVSAIPEGLPVAITVALTSASLAMARRNVIVRKLSAIEGLGSCTLIASDKTGTLTKNRLSVEAFVPHKLEEYGAEQLHVTRLASVLCNEVTIDRRDEELTFIGDQVDVALARHAITADEAYILAAKDYRKVDEIPYEPQNRFSAILVEKEGSAYEFIKGSPETVLKFCALSDGEREAVMEEVAAWAAKGYRNIAIAYKQGAGSSTIALSEFVYLGFMAIIDPIREESTEAVRRAKEAGIVVAMVTGDHPHTAFYIAQQLGIAASKREVMDGLELQRWQEEGARPEAIASVRVFARVNPQQKQAIVKAFQQLGHFVAVTGDGVNDAPALRRANIGIAMGKSGTDIARSTGKLILTDDNFASIINGIEEGRRAYDNIRKVIFLLVSTGFAEIVLVLLAFATGQPLPLLPVQLLWLNLVTNGIQDVMLGLEKAEPGLLKRAPRPPEERVFNPLMLRRVLISGLYIGVIAYIIFYWLLQSGASEFAARNVTLLLMVLFENVHVFNSRTEVNYLHKMRYANSLPLIGLVIFTQLLHVGCMYLPFTQKLLSLEPVTFQTWSVMFAVSVGLVAVMEADKWRSRRRADVAS